jgi:hypothetical protein
MVSSASVSFLVIWAAATSEEQRHSPTPLSPLPGGRYGSREGGVVHGYPAPHLHAVTIAITITVAIAITVTIAVAVAVMNDE